MSDIARKFMRQGAQEEQEAIRRFVDDDPFEVEHHEPPKVPVLTPAQEAAFDRLIAAAKKFHPDPTRVRVETEDELGDHQRVRMYAVGIVDDDGNYHEFKERWPI